MPLKPGDRIERYIVDAPLGSGGMGEVYRAHDARLQRKVALKILSMARADGGQGSAPPSTNSPERMIREARAAAALDHPNVVAIFDVGQVDEPEELRGTTYIAMELIKGAPLRSYIGDAGIAMDKRVAWITDIARALAAAHAAGLVHRDIKPENVMIRDDGNVKVLDFGIAKRAAPVHAESPATTGGITGTLTADGVVLGTPLYMAPEHMRGESIDGRADQFSWGVVAYELLAGKSPWPIEAGSLAIVSQILSGMPPSLAQVAPDVLPHVADVVTRALAKDRAARFPSMDALLVALTGPAFAPVATRGSPPAVPSPIAQSVIMPMGPSATPHAQSAQPIEPPKPRAPWRALGAVAVAVAAIASVGAVATRRARTPPPTPSASAAPPLPSCTNRACVEQHGGQPYVCRASDHACVPVASEDCTAMYEPRDLLADDTVWMGAMFPTKGPAAAAFGTMNMLGTDFARREIASVTSALEGSNAAAKVHPVALVGCDDGADAMRAAHHLVDDVGVPAILGFRSGKEVTDIAGSLLIQRGVIAVATLTTSPQITRLPQPANLPRLVWRTTYSLDGVASATARMIEGVLEPRQTSKPTHVTLARADSTAGLSFAETFFTQLRFNGKPALENGRDYQEVILPTGKPSDAEVARLADAVAKGTPSFIIFQGDAAAIVPLAEAIEARSLVHKPTYLIATETTETFTAFLGKNEDRRHRLYVIDSPSSSNANARFVIRYNEAHKEQVTRAFNAAVSYDAFYLLAYGVLALGEGPASGTSLARAFGRLVPPGPRIEVGPTSVLDALATLSTGGEIDLQGASTSLDFDLATGEVPSDFTLFCSGVDAQGRASGEDLESGVVVRAKTGAVEGTPHCP